MRKLEGKVAVITAATSGMALATAQLFVEEGAYVFITGRRQDELDEAVKLIGKNVTGVQGDVSNLADLDRLYATVKDQKGKIDVLFANAGAGEFAAGRITEEHFDKTFNLNVRGLLFTVQKALPLFQDGGSIILNGSIAAYQGDARAFGVYSASKAAVRSFARTWTVDLKDRKIRVNTSAPARSTPRSSTPSVKTPKNPSPPDPPRWHGPPRRDRDRRALPRLHRLMLRQRHRPLRRRRHLPNLSHRHRCDNAIGRWDRHAGF